jgi:3-isopropylmalate/(R)-2-methylmalate dehydratase large subunit
MSIVSDAPLTLTAKILRAHGVEDTTPGTFAIAQCDLVLLNEVSGAVALPVFEELGADRVFDPDRVVLVVDHFVPAKDVRSAELAGDLRRFARRYGIENYYEVGSTPDAGIEHTLLPQLGFVSAGDFIPGGDSHTCTYGAFGAFGTGMGSSDIAVAMALGEVWVRAPEVVQVDYVGTPGPWVTGKDLILAYLAEAGVSGATYAALEFVGPAVRALNVDERMALCNMAVEAGAKTGIVETDDVTLDWLRDHVSTREVESWVADPGARYDRVTTIDVEGMAPRIARPHSPGDVVGIDEIPAGVRVDQVYVGNCANGTITDLRQLASVLEGQRVARGTRLIVVPATHQVHRQAMAEGLTEVIMAAGGTISPPTCGACFGGHMGILAPGERAVTTTNRNFRGRMGSVQSEVYLANAWVAGAAAVAGELVDPAGVTA